ncbi:hypothetical protein, partial [Klebsiella pneumoniae]
VPEKYLLKPECDVNSSHPVQVATTTEPQPISVLELPQPEASSLTPSNVSNTPLQVLFGHDAVRQNPLYWEPTNTAKFMNTNTGIIGT